MAHSDGSITTSTLDRRHRERLASFSVVPSSSSSSLLTATATPTPAIDAAEAAPPRSSLSPPPPLPPPRPKTFIVLRLFQKRPSLLMLRLPNKDRAEVYYTPSTTQRHTTQDIARTEEGGTTRMSDVESLCAAAGDDATECSGSD